MIENEKIMKIVTVIPLKKVTSGGILTYFTAKDIREGNIVTIPIRNKKILGLVISVEDAKNAKINIKDMAFNLKKISEVKEHSIWRIEYLESILEISKYFATTKNNTAVSLIPSIFREDYDKIAKFKNDLLETRNHPNLKTEKLIFQASTEDRISAYKTLIRESFAQKKSVFIVLPTEHDIKILYEILSKGIEQFAFSFHGELSKKKILEKFEQVVTIEHGVLILGTASFLSIPRKDIGVIVVEHESSGSYKMIPKPHLDLRVFAELFASKINARLILSDTLLRFETIARAEIDGLIPMHSLSFRINFDGEIKIENPRDTLEILPPDRDKTSSFKIFSAKTVEEIRNAVEKKKNVFIFSLRKGLATMTVCRDCGETVSCKKCRSPVVLYYSQEGKKRMFVCNRCQKEISVNAVCSLCGSWNLIPLGIGTDTVFEEIKKLFPKEKIFKLDKEIARNKKGAKKIVEEFEKNKGGILVGTEMAFFYLNNKIPLSIIASFDSLWGIPNFKMSEKIIQLLISVIENTRDKVIIQTKNEHDPAILAVKNGNLLSFTREELEDRKKLNYPPFKRFIKITHLGDKVETLKARKMLEEIFKEHEPEIFSGFITKLKNKYVTNALIKINPKKWSLSEISTDSSIDENLLNKLSALPPSFQVLVDPEDLL